MAGWVQLVHVGKEPSAGFSDAVASLIEKYVAKMDDLDRKAQLATSPAPSANPGPSTPPEEKADKVSFGPPQQRLQTSNPTLPLRSSDSNKAPQAFGKARPSAFGASNDPL